MGVEKGEERESDTFRMGKKEGERREVLIKEDERETLGNEKGRGER